ncbi:DUF1360 domain-containing protein [[Mycobacterium] kokjensenii]|uniref:DUF1360 domain-containing protein n=1 Tax=[Mycobacterium] kokjensenii TaxID=3064287 RepID=A0ABN9N854_9MYCO|nr:DUF1360 domain-containing protein [Mycolicibacter sp. MU0083]CAJ1502097.1 DUF1360 domain-containing protein [Mycolicibacter sp. MU0083]
MAEPRRSRVLRHSVGELLNCPFCPDMWVATWPTRKPNR